MSQILHTFTALSETGSTAYQFVGGISPKSAAFKVTLPDTPSSIIVKPEYSTDGAGDADAVGPAITLPDAAGTYVIVVATTYDYLRLTWVSGTIGAEETIAVALDVEIQG